jgi:hypothetical protein
MLQTKHNNQNNVSRTAKNFAPKHSSSRINVDWFSFLLACKIDYNLCTIYSQSFETDQIDETILLNVNHEILRTLGLKEGDIIKVIQFMDKKYNRTLSQSEVAANVTKPDFVTLTNNLLDIKSINSSISSTVGPTGTKNTYYSLEHINYYIDSSMNEISNHQTYSDAKSCETSLSYRKGVDQHN